MSEIPDDIMRTAYAVQHDVFKEGAPAIARAILAERKRCAEIADAVPLCKLKETTSTSHFMTFETGAKAQRRAIARAIMEPSR